MVAYLFRCVKCECEEVRTKDEVPYGEPLELVANCDHCNSRLEYVCVVGPEYMVRTTPDKE